MDNSNEKTKQKSYLICFTETMGFLMANPLFKIVIVPIVLLSVIAARFGVFVLKVISDIELYLITDVKKDYAWNLMIRYMTTPLIHYTLIFLNNCIVCFYVQNVIRSAFISFTNEYLLVNYAHYHKLGSGQIHSLIERRMMAMGELLKLFILRVFHDLCFVYMAYYEMYTKVDSRAFYANILLFACYIVSTHYIIKLRSNYRVKYNDAYNKSSNNIYGILVNYDIIKSYNNDDLEIKKLEKNLDIVESRGVVFDILTTMAEYVQKNALVMPNGIILYLAISGTYFHNMQSKAGFVLYNKLFLSIKDKIANIRTDVLKLSQYLTDISDSRVVDEKPDNDHKGLDIFGFEDKIEFRNVSLYINDKILLHDVNFVINKGEKVAIVGKNGTGKSSLINILLRLRDYEGEIFINNLEMKDVSKVSQRNLISYIPQNPSIFEGTVIENLQYSNINHDKEKIRETCIKYKTHDMFSSLPDGYDTQVGEAGKFLSGGQKQRLSFMRAVIKNGDIFLFDEPTSNLDVKSEEETINYIFTSLKEKTSIIILHNPAYLSKFDKILGFSNGTINVYKYYNEYLKEAHLY